MKLIVAILAVTITVLVSAQSNAIDIAVDEPTKEYLPPIVEEKKESASAKLADDGYIYKTIRKLKYRSRHRRDVSQEYLVPVQRLTQKYLPPNNDKADAKIAEDGYSYQTVRKLKFRSRHKRDVVNEIEQPINEYLPPAEVKMAPDLKTILGDDGYRYKTVRRLKYRRHRRDADDVNEPTPVNEYLPPAKEEKAAAPDDTIEAKSAVLANDGYRYKTVHKIKYQARQ